MEKMVGIVLWFDDERGFGFLAAPGQDRLFVHHTAIVGLPGRKTLTKGQSVYFELGSFNGRPCAQNVVRLTGSGGAQMSAALPGSPGTQTDALALLGGGSADAKPAPR